MSVITVLNASKTYGNEDELKVEALKPASFSVEKGEFVCIIGTSGSGNGKLSGSFSAIRRVHYSTEC